MGKVGTLVNFRRTRPEAIFLGIWSQIPFKMSIFMRKLVVNPQNFLAAALRTQFVLFLYNIVLVTIQKQYFSSYAPKARKFSVFSRLSGIFVGGSSNHSYLSGIHS